jgi:hypothetical protein
LIAIVGCGKRKRAEEWCARDLYTGGVTLARFRYAEREASDWRILSALYGVIHPDEVVEPYDYTIRDLREAGRIEQWASNAAFEIFHLTVVEQDRDVELHLGEAYARPLVPELEARGLTPRLPVRGLGTGKLLSWYKDRAIEARRTHTLARVFTDLAMERAK